MNNCVDIDLDKSLIEQIYDLQQENQQLKEEIQDLKADYGSLAQVERDIYESVIDEVKEFLKEFHNYENRFKWCEQDYIDTIYEIEKILDKANIKESE